MIIFKTQFEEPFTCDRRQQIVALRAWRDAEED